MHQLAHREDRAAHAAACTAQQARNLHGAYAAGAALVLNAALNKKKKANKQVSHKNIREKRKRYDKPAKVPRGGVGAGKRAGDDHVQSGPGSRGRGGGGK